MVTLESPCPITNAHVAPYRHVASQNMCEHGSRGCLHPGRGRKLTAATPLHLWHTVVHFPLDGGSKTL